jgi:hypothetical protein
MPRRLIAATTYRRYERGPARLHSGPARTAASPDNVEPDSRLGVKFGWYRLTSGYRIITGWRLDAPALHFLGGRPVRG